MCIRDSTYDVIPKFINLAIENKDLTIYGDGNQARDFTYIDDMINAFLLMGFHKNAIGKCINFGTGISYTINKLANLIIKLSNLSFMHFYNLKIPTFILLLWVQ